MQFYLVFNLYFWVVATWYSDFCLFKKKKIIYLFFYFSFWCLKFFCIYKLLYTNGLQNALQTIVLSLLIFIFSNLWASIFYSLSRCFRYFMLNSLEWSYSGHDFSQKYLSDFKKKKSTCFFWNYWLLLVNYF